MLLRALLSLAVLWVSTCYGPATASGQKGKRYRVRITSKPAGATLYVDDKSKGPVGETPWNGRLTAGPHVLVLELEGHQTLVKDFRVRKRWKRQVVKVELVEIETGTLEVTAADDNDTALGAKVMIDGEPKGEVPTGVEVDAGAHQVELTKEGYRRYEEWVEVSKGKTVIVKISMVPKVPPKTSKPEKKKASPGAGPLVIAGVGLEAGWRRYRYTNPRTPPLLPLKTSSVALFHLRVDGYPLVRARDRRLRSLSLSADVALAAPIESSTQGGGEAIDTVWRELDLGARYALAFKSAGEVGARVGYGQTLFTFRDPGALVGQLPDVDYRFIRLGVDGGYRFEVAKVALRGIAGADYHAVVAPGPLAKRFAGASVFGIDLHVGLRARIRERIEARLTGSFTQYGYSFESMPGDTYDADGGRDRFYGLQLLAAYVH